MHWQLHCVLPNHVHGDDCSAVPQVIHVQSLHLCLDSSQSIHVFAQVAATFTQHRKLTLLIHLFMFESAGSAIVRMLDRNSCISTWPVLLSALNAVF